MLKYIFPLLIVLVACKNDQSKDSKKAEKANVVVHLKDEAEMDERIIEIDAIVEDADMVASSLFFSKGETGESIEVNGYMNKDNVILRIEESFCDGNGLNSGLRIYYLNDGKPFVTHEKYDEVVNGVGRFVDRISYYDEKGKVVKTKERRSDYEEMIDKESYKPVNLLGISMDRAMRALNQEKEFATTFQGFIDQDVFSYLSVGENNPNGFRSALRCDYKDELIKVLRTNETGFVGEPLRVNYQKHTDETSGFRFQVYAGGEFVNKK